MAKSTLFDTLAITPTTSFALPGRGMPVEDVEEDTPEQEDEDTETADEPTEQEDLELEQEGSQQETDEEESEETDESEDEALSYEPFFQDLVAEGILHDNEEGYEDSIEGFRQAIADSRDKELEKVISLLPPTAQKIMQLAMKGAIEDDIQQLLTLEDGPDWETVNMADEDIQVAAIEEALRLREPDITDEEVEEKIEDLRDLGKLQKTAERDQKFLVRKQAEQKESVAKEVEARETAAKAQYEQGVATVTKYIQEASEIAGDKLTKADRDGFIAYLFQKDKDGKTAAEKNNTPERQIQKEYLNYKNFNVEKVARKVTTEITQNMKRQLARHAASKGASQPVRPEKNNDASFGKLASPAQMIAAINKK